MSSFRAGSGQHLREAVTTADERRRNCPDYIPLAEGLRSNLASFLLTPKT